MERYIDITLQDRQNELKRKITKNRMDKDIKFLIERLHFVVPKIKRIFFSEEQPPLEERFSWGETITSIIYDASYYDSNTVFCKKCLIESIFDCDFNNMHCTDIQLWYLEKNFDFLKTIDNKLAQEKYEKIKDLKARCGYDSARFEQLEKNNINYIKDILDSMLEKDNVSGQLWHFDSPESAPEQPFLLLSNIEYFLTINPAYEKPIFVIQLYLLAKRVERLSEEFRRFLLNLQFSTLS